MILIYAIIWTLCLFTVNEGRVDPTHKGDPCFNYDELNESWRKYGTGYSSYCDKAGHSGAHSGGYNKWFRITGSAGNRLYDRADGTCGYRSCGSTYSIWINGYARNIPIGKDIPMPLCAHDNSYVCSYNYGAVGVGVRVKHCPGGYFVYYLPEAYDCYSTFCTLKDSNRCYDSMCEYGCRVSGNQPVCTCPSHLVLSKDKVQCLPQCAENNGGCSNICFNYTTKPSECGCPKHLTLEPSDNKTCIKPCLLSHANCSHYCWNDKKRGAVCGCPKDMILDFDNKTCVKGPCQQSRNCSHICNDVNSITYECSCPTGMVLKGDKLTCSLNECNFENGGCSHKCSRSAFSNKQICGCPKNMKLDSYGKTCVYIDRCRNSPCSPNATCEFTSENGQLICTCHLGFTGNGFKCRPESPDDETSHSCKCQVYGEERLKRGPKLFELPTLIYGIKAIWISGYNGTTPISITDAFPNFESSLMKRSKEMHVEAHRRRRQGNNFQKCIKIWQRCSSDCGSVAKLIINDGLSTQMSLVGSTGKSYKNPLGQIMCDRLHMAIATPGMRPAVYYDPLDCGRMSSTYVFDDRLCCKEFSAHGFAKIVLWNRKCDPKISVSDILSG